MVRRALQIGVGLFAVLAVSVLGVFAAANSDWGRARIIALIEEATASGPVSVRIGAIDGALPGRVELRDVVAADGAGAFAEARLVVLDWRVRDLLAGRVSVDTLSFSDARLDRLPVLPETPEQPKPLDPEPLSLKFESPGIEIAVDRLTVDGLTVGKAVAGEAVTVSADLSAGLNAGEARVRGWIEAVRPSMAPARAEIDLALAPGSGELRAELSLHEPENGLVAGMLAVDGRPALDLSLTGDGGLDGWRGALKGGFGPDARVDLDLNLATGPDGSRLAVDGSIAAARLAPPELRPLLAIPATVDLAVLARPDGSIGLESLKVSLPQAVLTATGEVDADGVPVSAAADLAVPDLAALSDLVGAAVDGPVLAGDVAVAARLDDSGRRLAVRVDGAPAASGIVLDDLTLTVTAEADEALARMPERVRVALDGGVVTPAVEGLDTVGLLGPRLDLSAAGSVATRTGAATVDRFVLGSAGVRVEGRVGIVGGNRLTPALTVTAGDLGRFSALVGRDMAGELELSVDGSVDLDPLDVSAALALTGTRLGVGDPGLDSLVGPSPTLTAGVALGPDDLLHIIDLSLDAETVHAGGAATVDLGTGAIDGRVDLAAPNLSALSAVAGADLAGDAAVAIALGGTLEAPAASASWRLVRLAVAGTQIGETTGSVTASGLPDAPAGDMRATASLRGESVELAVRYALAGRVLTLRDLSLGGLGAQVSGNVAVDLETMLARGDLSASAADLGLIGSSLDLPLAAGTVQGAVALADTEGQGVSLTLDLTGLALEDGTDIGRAYLDASLSDVTGVAGGRLNAWVTDAASGGLALKAATLRAEVRDGLADLSLNAEGDIGVPAVLALTAQAPIDPADGPINIGRLAADLGDVAIRQRGPIQVALLPTPRIDGIDLAIDDGRLSGHAGFDMTDLDIAIAIRDLPAALARLADPTLELDGRIVGDIAVSGPIENPTADVTLSTAGLRTLAPDLADMPPLVADLSLALAQRRATARLKASVGDGATASLAAAIQGTDGQPGAPPVFDAAAPLEATLDADLDLARVSAFLPLDLVALGGSARARITADGTAGAPALAGAVTVDAGEVDVPSAGLYLRDLTVRAEGDGGRLVIRRFDARAAGGGTLSVSGSLSVEPDAGFPADVTLVANGFQAVDMDLATVSVDMDLGMRGSLPEYLLAGKITVLPTEIRIPDTLPPSVSEIEVIEISGGKVIETPEQQARREAELRRGQEAGAPLRLDVEIDVPGQVFVRGRGLDSEWIGSLAVTGRVDAPSVDGEISVRRGTLNAVGNTFDFARGRVVFDGGPPENPALDMRLDATLPDITAAIVVGGRADDPQISLESTPALPEDEILSRILFGSSQAELTPLQALQLARSAAILSGSLGSGTDLASQVRDTLGLDTLNVDTRSNDDGSVGASLSVGKYIAPGVFLKLQQGLSGDSSRAVVEVEVSDTISVETDVGADSQSRVGVTYELDY